MVIVNSALPGTDLDSFYSRSAADFVFRLVAAGYVGGHPVISSLLARPDRPPRVVSTIANLMLAALLVLAVIVFVAAPVLSVDHARVPEASGRRSST